MVEFIPHASRHSYVLSFSVNVQRQQKQIVSLNNVEINRQPFCCCTLTFCLKILQFLNISNEGLLVWWSLFCPTIWGATVTLNMTVSNVVSFKCFCRTSKYQLVVELASCWIKFWRVNTCRKGLFHHPSWMSNPAHFKPPCEQHQ